MNDEAVRAFGEILKEAREEQKISLAEVSETLKLSVEKIIEIEDSKAELLPPAAFTCGYLRLYSKLVVANENQVIDAYYQALGESRSDGVLSATSDIPSQANSGHLGMKFVSYSFVLIIAVLIIVWMQGDSSDQVSQQADVIEAGEILSDADKGETELPDNKPVTKPVNNLDSDIKIQLSENINSINNDQADSVKDSVSPEIEMQQEVIIPDVDSVEDDSEETEKIIALAKEASPVAETGDDIVILKANDDCWIEISDANEHLLYFSLLKKGEVVELKGQEPFKVFLGKASAVSVVLNKIDYDVSDYVRSNQVARFLMTMDKALEMQILQ